jgi:hypothetical protein
MLDELFKFPIVMVDGENEERKRIKKEEESDRMALPKSLEADEYDLIYGEAEYPYLDFIGFEDRWLPSTDSFDNALRGKFDACMVKFVNTPQLLVPWSRKKFKDELSKFIDKVESLRPVQTDKGE